MEGWDAGAVIPLFIFNRQRENPPLHPCGPVQASPLAAENASPMPLSARGRLAVATCSARQMQPALDLPKSAPATSAITPAQATAFR